MGQGGRLGARRLVAGLCLLGALAVGSPAAAARAEPEAQAAVIGGEATSIQAFPSLTYIQARGKDDRGFSCTGTVIAPRVVLTAAHCVENLDAGGFVAVTDYRLATGFANPVEAKAAKQVRQVSATHVFPEFDPGTLWGDAAILILASPTGAPPIALATGSDSALFEGGARVLLAGWGLLGGGASAPPKWLRTAETTVQSPRTCEHQTRRFYPPYSAEFQLCTRNPPTLATGTCFGDSGGPAIVQRPDASQVEIGITSTGGPGCNPRMPDVFTRTDRLSAWTSAWIAATEAGAPAPTLPRARIPRLAMGSARGFAGSALAGSFGRRFLRARAVEAGCVRIARARVGCDLQWEYGPSIFFGTIAVFYASRRNAVVWDSRLRIRSVNAHCVFSSGHPFRCPVRAERRLR